MKVCLLFFWAMVSVVFGGVVEDRKAEAELRGDGNWKEALALDVKLLKAVSDEKSAEDLRHAMECVRQLNEWGEFEGLMGIVDEVHGENGSVLRMAGEVMMGVQHHGMVVGGEFVRGGRNHRAGGEYGNVVERDRVRAVNYYLRAIELLEGDGKVSALQGLGRGLQHGRTGNQSWKLQVKSDFVAMPEVVLGYHYGGGTGGAPVDADGNPVFYEMPVSFEAAGNDGERWRWAMAERVRVDAKQRSLVDQEWAGFLYGQFGVRTLAQYGFFGRRNVGGDAEEKKDGVMQLHTLKDDETVCRLAAGVKRFALPEGQNYLRIYRGLLEGGDLSAGDQLVQIYLDRRQYVKAQGLLEGLVAKGGNEKDVERREALLKQVVGNWGQFDYVGKAFVKGSEPRVGMVYRNAESVKISAYAVDVDGIYEDVWKFLKSDPEKFSWNDVQLRNHLGDLLNGERNQFVGEKVGERVYELKPKDNLWDVRGEFGVPVKKGGAYLVKGEIEGSDPFYTMVWVEELVVVTKNVEGGKLVYVADAVTGAPVAEAKVALYGWRSTRVKNADGRRRNKIFTVKLDAVTDENGQALVKGMGNKHQWFSHVTKGDLGVWSGMNRHWWYGSYEQNYSKVGAFGMTSQPVYRPGKQVHGKFWVKRAAYDLGDVSAFAGKRYELEIRDPKNELLGDKLSGNVGEFGGVPFEVEVGDDAVLGVYRVQVRVAGNHYGQMTFRVEQYKKPEYEVTVDAPKDGVQLGEKFEAVVRATYYHGAPVTNAKVKVKVMRHDYSKIWFPWGRWDWLYGEGYGWLDIERPWYPGWGVWGCRCPLPWWYGNHAGRPELVFEREMEIGADGTVKVPVDTELAKMMHGDSDHRYEISAEVVDASRRTIFGKGSVLATREPYQVRVWLDRGYARVGDKVTGRISARTLDGKVVNATGEAVLYKVSYDANGKAEEKVVREWDVAEHPEGIAKVEMEASKAGQYRFVAKMKDEKGREVEGAVLFTVRGEGALEGDFRYNDLELIADKRTYSVGDVVKLLVNTKQADSWVMVFVRGTEERYLLKMDGKSKELEIPVKAGDMPNFFVEAFTVSDATVHTSVREFIVPPEKRVLNIAVLPDAEKYKPGSKGKVKVRVTGLDGEPVKGEVVLAIYDKALEYISGGSNSGDIKEFFWKWRRHFRGGFEDSLHAGFRSQVKRGEVGMQFLGVFGRSLADDSSELAKDKAGAGFGGGGADRRRLAKSAAPSARAGAVREESSVDAFADGDEAGGEADGGGDADVVVRKDFADSIKWKGRVELDENGVGMVDVSYPDNLTTWKVKAWAVAHGTRVGEGEAEVVTSKDLIVRLQAPRFFVEKDEVVLSAVVHNYHAAAKDVRVLLEMEGGTLETADVLEKRVSLKADGGEERIDWRVKVKGEGKAIVRMKVIADDDSDAMEMTFPVFVHGIEKQFAWSRVIEPGKDSVDIEIDVPEERRPEESWLQVNYSPTIAGAIVDALPYLASYPYGCTEQTLNRFVPTVVAQKLLLEMGIDLESVRNKRVNLNPQELGDSKERAAQWKHWKANPVFNKGEVDKMVRVGVKRLLEMQLSDGGWGWFSGYGEYSSAHTTSVVVHGLWLAKKNGADVPEDRLKQGVAWLKRYEEREAERIRMWGERKRNVKKRADQRDAFVRLVLAENGVEGDEMMNFLFRDKNDLGIYAKCLLGMSLHLDDDAERRDAVIRNVEQFLKYDDENQSAYLEMRNTGYWWYWYGSEFEAHAWYLKLKAATDPKGKAARGVVKYLVNNRKHATYWNSTRDTAFCIEAIADYMRASGESAPECEVEVLYDGKLVKTVKVTKDNLFSFDSKMTLGGDALSSGKHKVTIRRKGEGALYANTYLKVFTKEDFIEKTGLEVKVERTFYKLVRDESQKNVVGADGQVVKQKEDKYERVLLKSGDAVKSGDIIEVELVMESKNDYEYLLFEDWKAAGMEAEEVRSGYLTKGLRAYMEVKDEKVCFFVRSMPRGKHSLSYRLRAEIPGKFSALPAIGEGMYAPELRANSNEMKVEVVE